MSDIYLSITETPTVVTLTNPLISSNVAQSVTVTNVVSVSVVTMPAISVSGGLTNAELRASSVTVALDASSLSALEQVTVTIGAAVSISNFPSTQTVAGTVTANGFNYDENAIEVIPIRNDGNDSRYIPVGPSFNDAGDSITLPISGTVAANLFGYDQANDQQAKVQITEDGYLAVALQANNLGNIPISGTVTVGNSVTIGSLPAISGTVTIGASSVTFNANVGTRSDGSRHPLSLESGSNYVNARVFSPSAEIFQATVTARLQDASGNNLTSTSIGGLQRLNVSLASAATPGGSLPSFVNVYGGSDGSAVRTISVDSSGRQNINAQFPRVTLIDGSGTVATANTAITVFASSSTRSYLLVQVTTGSAFVNVGATATTVNGINLTAGQGYSWETTIPQGIVSLISTTTNSRYVAKEA